MSDALPWTAERKSNKYKYYISLRAAAQRISEFGCDKWYVQLVVKSATLLSQLPRRTEAGTQEDQLEGLEEIDSEPLIRLAHLWNSLVDSTFLNSCPNCNAFFGYMNQHLH